MKPRREKEEARMKKGERVPAKKKKKEKISRWFAR